MTGVQTCALPICNGIEGAKEIDGGEYDLTYADLGAYLDTKPNGILGGDTGTTITAGTEITLKDFHTGIGGGDVRIDGTVNITGAQFQGATYGIANSTTVNPGSELEIHADRYIGKDCLLTYNGGHLLMIVAENGDGNNIVQGRLSIGNVSRFWYRTDENGAYTEINVKVKGNPSGEVISRVEQPRGECMYYVKGNGSKYLDRVRIRTPTFANIPPLLHMVKGIQLADVPVVVLSIDPCISCTER